ncbi:S8/S53 family peptidase [uncultured Psychroserpens sp.]|uniref:S8/S53 family peptidase n=1 Tax=uncultured Psychroserpens sp. TaxID=255436 RepID=UPI00260D2CB0|nr:S8/S53 family peptidase [uncultured Psychroserpens sp.]
MKKLITITISFCILFLNASNAQTISKKNVTLNESYTLYIKISSKIDLDSGKNLLGSVLQKIPALEDVYKETPFQLKKGIALSVEKLRAIENAGIQKRKGKRIGLENILKVRIENPTYEKLLSLKKRMEKIMVIEYCHLVSNRPPLPPNDIFPETPSFRNQQEYIDEDPGVNMQYAWDIGVDGSGIFVRNIEYGFNKAHEELNDVNAFYAPGRTVHPLAYDYLGVNYTEHGTSVIGTIYADNGDYGVTGMVSGVEEVILHPEWTEEYISDDNIYGWDRIATVSEAIANTTSGNVIIYEMQSNDNGPAELDPVIWDLTKAATDAGIIIVAAAGNGAINLDAPAYSEYMSRGDSGAIIVGAGTSDTNHDALFFSTYGTRIDLQGWGNNVFTSGANAAVEVIDGDVNQSYTNFTGTSSATAIVASCVIAVQSFYFNNTGAYLSGEELKNILRDTGIAQGTLTSSDQPIGPLPNMEAALNYLDPIVNCNGYVYGNFDSADADFADGNQCTAFPSGHFNAAWNTPFPWKATEFYAAYHILLTEDYWGEYGCTSIVNQGTETNVWMLGSSNPIDTSPAGNKSVMAFWVKRKHYESNYNGVYIQLNDLEVGDQYKLTFYDSPVSTPGGRQTPNLYYKTKVKVEDALGVQEWEGPNTHYYYFNTTASNTWYERELIFKVTSSSMKLTLEFPLYPDPENIVNDGYVAIDDIKLTCVGGPQGRQVDIAIDNETIESTLSENITLYPNPTKGLLKIDLKNTKDSIDIVKIYNLQGALVKSQKPNNSNAIDFKGLQNGMYFVKIKTSSGKQITQKVIKI